MAQEKGQSFPSKEKLPTQKSWEKGTRCLEELGVGEWVGERRLEGKSWVTTGSQELSHLVPTPLPTLPQAGHSEHPQWSVLLPLF